MLFGFLFTWPPFWAILLVSFVITLSTTLLYKYTTNQARMRELKKTVKEYQEKIKKSRDKPEKMMKLQQEAMQYNLELMKHSFKPTLYTMIPLLLLFVWLNAHMAYQPLLPDQEFTLTATYADGVTGTTNLSLLPEGLTLLSNATALVTIPPGEKGGVVEWTLRGSAGAYKAIVTFAGSHVEKEFEITSEPGHYDAPLQTYKGGVKSILVGNKPTRPFGESFNLFGWHPGWIAAYILTSIALSMLFRKAFNVV